MFHLWIGSKSQSIESFKTLKILFLSHRFYPDIGGIEVNSEILAKAFHNAGHSVHLLTWSEDGSGKEFPFLVVRNPSIIDLVSQHHWADIVYENNICLRLAWPSVLLLKPSVVSIRTLVCRSDGRRQWQDRLKLKWLKRARSVIAVSDFIRRRTWPSATVIGNPYRADIFSVHLDSRRRGSFVFLGRLVSDKGADLAIKAIHYLSDGSRFPKIPDADPYTLTIIGDGPFREELENLVKELHIELRVRFMGMLTGDALVACLNDHKYILVPSMCEEAFGNVALEGMACGCIPIVSDAGGLPGAVGDAGLIFSKGDVDSLARQMREVLNDNLLDRKLRTAAAAHLVNHRPDVITQRYLDEIEKATANIE